MARHAFPRTPTARRALAALATAGVALGAGAATASAADGAVAGVTGTAGHAAAPVTDLRPNPLAGTGVDPLDNGVETTVADFAPLDSRALTGPVAQAPSVGSVPVAEQAAGLVR
ncbi:hypothetical protein GCM10010377_37520 [Streptomyces viridiviolaceus]|uniref:ATP-binding protein n=1 Tax=Streptomyces viridiviolaceus TaxID=68282 RepID=A0ABW2E9R6_9ACTN|nr:hypothetical protein [Streptomyces viridiviolaceus]GHB43267.1 hypothetical protein GCM10010377_37520 [Streptomyces viridiviolaceus]